MVSPEARVELERMVRSSVQSVTVESIVDYTLHAVPEHASTCWSTRSLDAKHGVGKDTAKQISLG